jgi:hypothetical protein
MSQRYSLSDSGYFKTRFAPFAAKHPVRSAALVGASAAAIGAGVYGWGAAVTMAQAVGFAAFMLARESATFRDHRHMLAVASSSCILSAAQQGIMAALDQNPGAYAPGGIMLGHAALSLAAFAVVPETKKILRGAITWGGGAAGAAAAAYASYKYESGTGIIPAMTTLGNSALFSIKDTGTPRARLGYIGMNLGHLFYWASQPVQSLALAFTEAMYIATHGCTLQEHDIPVKDRKTGHSFTSMERLSLYFKNVIARGEKAEDIGMTRHQEGRERPDNRFYKEIRRLVLG